MDVHRTHPALVDDAYRRVLDALARTTTEAALFAELCAAAVERDGIQHASVATKAGDVVVARGRDVSGQTFALGLTDGATLTLQAAEGFTPEDLAWARQLAVAAELIEGVRETIANRFRKALAGSELALFIMDRELRYTWLEGPAAVGADRAIGRTDAELLSARRHRGGDGAQAAGDRARRARRTGDRRRRPLFLDLGAAGPGRRRRDRRPRGPFGRRHRAQAGRA